MRVKCVKVATFLLLNIHKRKQSHILGEKISSYRIQYYETFFILFLFMFATVVYLKDSVRVIYYRKVHCYFIKTKFFFKNILTLKKKTKGSRSYYKVDQLIILLTIDFAIEPYTRRRKILSRRISPQQKPLKKEEEKSQRSNKELKRELLL